MKKIDFDNADLMIVGCVLIILGLVIAAAVADDISLTDIKELITYFALIASSLANPEKTSRQVVGLLRKRRPEKAPPASVQEEAAE
jgi:hypothetical protein